MSAHYTPLVSISSFKQRKAAQIGVLRSEKRESSAVTSSSTGGGTPRLEVTASTFRPGKVLVLQRQKLVSCESIASNGITRKGRGDEKREPLVEYPWYILLLSHNSINRLNGIHVCHALRKLDLSNNAITVLPNRSFWACLPELQILHLNGNSIDSIHALEDLGTLSKLTILSVYDNPVEHHPVYRHLLVNVLPSVKLVDFYLVSDEELVEGADFGERFGAFSPRHELILPRYTNLTESEEMRILEYELQTVRKAHAHASPVILIQSFMRGALLRKTMRVYNVAASVIQSSWRKHRANRRAVTNKQKQELDNMQTLYVLHTDDLAVHLFRQIVLRLEQVSKISAEPLCDAHMALLSSPDNSSDYPLVRRIPQRSEQDIAKHTHIRPGRSCSPASRRRMRVLKRRGYTCPTIATMLRNRASKQQQKGSSAAVVSDPASSSSSSSSSALPGVLSVEVKHKPILTPAATVESKPKPSTQLRLLKFRSPTVQFHERLLHEINRFNVQSGVSGRTRRIHVYPGLTCVIMAAVATIQSSWRSYSARKHIVPSIGERVVQRRAVSCLVRWWKTQLLKKRLRMLLALKRFGDGIESRHLYVRRDVYSIIDSAPNQFVSSLLFPEFAALFDVDDGKYQSRNSAAAGGNEAHRAAHGYSVERPLGKDGEPVLMDHPASVFVHEHVGNRHFPYPLWLSAYWKEFFPVLLDDPPPQTVARRELPLCIRLRRLISASPSVETSEVRMLKSLLGNQGLVQSQNPNEGFIRVSFKTIAEARKRALTLFVSTWDPKFYDSVALMLTNKHVELLRKVSEQRGRSLTPREERAHLIERLMRPSMSTAYASSAHRPKANLFKDAQGAREARVLHHMDAIDMDATSVTTFAGATKGGISKLLRGGSQTARGLLTDTRRSHAQNSQNLIGRRRRPESASGVAARKNSDLGLRGSKVSASVIFNSDTRVVELEMTRREVGEAQRLSSRRIATEKRMRAREDVQLRRNRNREQHILHRVKMQSSYLRTQRGLTEDHELALQKKALAKEALIAVVTEKQRRVHLLLKEQEEHQLRKDRETEDERKQLRSQVAHQREAVATARVVRQRANERFVNRARIRRQGSQSHQHRLRQEKEAAMAFSAAQFTIAKRRASSMNKKQQQEKVNQVKHRIAAVKVQRKTRRKVIRENLYHSFREKQHNTRTQQTEMRQKLALRKMQEDQLLEMKRARRDHIAAVRAMALSATRSHRQRYNPVSTPGRARDSKRSSWKSSEGGGTINSLNEEKLSVALARQPLLVADTLPSTAASNPQDPLNDEHLSVQVQVLADLAHKVQSGYKELKRGEMKYARPTRPKTTNPHKGMGPPRLGV